MPGGNVQKEQQEEFKRGWDDWREAGGGAEEGEVQGLTHGDMGWCPQCPGKLSRATLAVHDCHLCSGHSSPGNGDKAGMGVEPASRTKLSAVHRD